MILKEEKLNIESSGIKEKSNFAIKASSKAFRILSSGLYSNKTRAVIRETSTNAYDAHVAAGKADIPFEVHLPTWLEMEFSVRDFGPGLSHEDMVSIYTTYFESTKNNSNDYVGCLGLGTKSPFAYTDTFSVTSFFNGQARDYSCFIGEDGFPNISLMAHYHTDEPNGLKVIVPVDKKDISSFVNEATSVYSSFQLKPKCNIVLNYPIQDFISLDNYRFYKSRNYYDGIIIMGNVAYPHKRQINGNAFVYNAEIGELEITASRESLELTPKTNARLDEIVSKGKALLDKYITDELASCSTYWEAYKKYRSEGFDNYTSNAHFNGQQLCANVYLSENYDVIKFSKKDWGRRQLRSEEVRYVNISEKVFFVINDKDVKPNVKINAFLLDNTEYKVAYVIKPEQVDSLKEYGIPDNLFKKLSEIKISRNNSTGEKREKYILKLDYTRRDNLPKISSKEDFDLDTEGYYVLLDGYNIEDDKLKNKHWDSLRGICYYLDKLSSPFKLFGIPKSSHKLVSKSKLVHITSLIDEQVKRFEDKGWEMNHAGSIRLFEFIKKIDTDYFREIAKLVEETEKNEDLYVKAKSLFNYLGLDYPKNDLKVFEKYPMVDMLIKSNVEISDYKVIEDYIKLEDSKNV